MSPIARNSAILIGCMLTGMASGAIAAANDYLFRDSPWRYDEPQYSEDLNFQYIWRIDTPTMDVDGDGNEDVIYYLEPWGPDGWIDEDHLIRWFRNLGNGRFEPGDPSTFANIPNTVHLGHIHTVDVDGDGRKDLVAASAGLDAEPLPMERNQLLLWKSANVIEDVGLGDPNFDYLGFTHALDTADIDNDGDVDLMFADIFVYDPDWTATIEDLYRLLINDGEGNFTRSTSRFLPNEVTGLMDISFVDVTGDEVPELIIGSIDDHTRNETQLFFNDGHGNFDSVDYLVLPPVHNEQGELMQLTCAVEGLDFDGDGDNDLVLVRSYLADLHEYSDRAVQLLQNDGSANFLDVTDTLAPASASTRRGDPPCWMSVIDFNLDGLDDLIFHFAGQDGIDASTPDWIWIQKEQGGFDELEPDHIPVHGAAYPIDFDNDGDTDLVVRSYDRKLVPFEGNFAWINDYVWSVLENTTIDPSSGLNIPLLLELLDAKEE